MSECSARRSSRRIVEHEKWMNCYFRKLASLYRKSPCLWKKDTRGYLDSEYRHRAYSRIHRAMELPGVTFVEIVLKIREMRRLYVNELKRLLGAKSYGHCYEISLPWFYNLHQFLYPYLDYDEAVELHNVDETFAKNENCSCFRCLISSRNTRIEHFLPSSAQRTIPTLNSISSPAVSLPEVKTRPRTCPRSCSRISYTKKRLDRSPSPAICTTISRCTSCLEHRGDMAENELRDTREVKCHEFTICGLHSTASSDDTCDTDSDQLETFSMTVTRCLRKLDKPYALKAQAEIQQILENMLIKSKNNSPKRTRLHESSYDL
ncbi:uncharacterized protein LOC122574220 [Bombus pyrosoma]|uniref:uncharacterized protein LOC122574220 n=1 Tax=Bombus pyrosoma TaxID=396416 RepID=UPI001CB8A8B4|nr:uncharacterized protein LOC122574220 [Bombus pyrosoma]XP_043597485.1 uncharacterized protein LOC122574220 [Bombus pyrosoma]XP_043597486.1 uncharacterized protein LOC122574220 [Bombus pyrosoma]